MSPIIKKKNKSYGFTIGISIAVVLMLVIVILTISSSKASKADDAKIQYSSSVSVVPATVGEKTGQATLPPFDEVAQSGADPAVGQIVPQITGQKFDETRFTIAPGDKPYVLIFLAHWCPNCQAEVPKLVKLHQEGSLPEDVEIYSIPTATTNTRANFPPSRWLLREDWPWDSVLDTEASQIANAFGLPGYPYMVFVNGDGTVSRRVSGQIPETQFVSYINAISAQ